MTPEETASKPEAVEKEASKITFKCQSCEQYRPLEDMTVIARFFPLLIVCRECARVLR